MCITAIVTVTVKIKNLAQTVAAASLLILPFDSLPCSLVTPDVVGFVMPLPQFVPHTGQSLP